MFHAQNLFLSPSCLALIPVHTRVLFDILQEAYRVKIDGKSPGAGSHLAQTDLIDPSIKNDPLSTTTSTTLPTNDESTPLLYPSESTESAPIIRADNIQLEKIFPKISTVSTSTIEDSTVSAGTSTINETNLSSELTSESTMDNSSATEFTSSSTVVSTEDLSTMETAAENLTTAIVDQIETVSSSITDEQQFTNATETFILPTTSASEQWSTYNSTNEPIPNSTNTMLETTPPVTETVTNTTEMHTSIIASTASIADGTKTIINAASTDTEAIEGTSVEPTTTAAEATALIMTTEQLLPVEGLLEALNNSETLRNQLLYKLCRQLLSHILPNTSSSSSAAATARALDMVSNSSITMNRTANALLSWIQEQLGSSTSTTTPTTIITTTATTTTTSSSTRSTIQSLLVKATELPSIALQRVDMDEVLGYANANADGELSS